MGSPFPWASAVFTVVVCAVSVLIIAFAIVFFLSSASDVMVNGHVASGLSDSIVVVLFGGICGAYTRHRVRGLRDELDLWRQSRTP